MTITMPDARPTRHWLRSTGAVLAGFAAVAVLSIATDTVLHAVNFYPNDGTAGTDPELAVALAYRAAYTVLGGSLTAWLAPSAKLRHAVVLGVIGTAFAALGPPRCGLSGTTGTLFPSPPSPFPRPPWAVGFSPAPRDKLSSGDPT